MDGFKNSTKTQYSMGGYAKGGSKFGKVMGEFKAGTLHSGSKKGAEVTNPKQAVAIALSEARKAGAKLPVKKQLGGTMTPAEKRMNAIQKNETGRASKPATSKPATTSGNKPMTDAEKRMVDIEKNETGGYKKGGMAKHSRADALRAQKYKAAMASRPKREPIVSGGPSSAASLAPLIRRAMAAKATQAAAAPPMEAAAPPMMGAPAMKKGGKFMKKAEGEDVKIERTPRGTRRMVKQNGEWVPHPVDLQVSNDIDARDDADIDKLGLSFNGVEIYPDEKKGVLFGSPPSKLERLAGAEAVKRQNRLGDASRGFDEETGTGMKKPLTPYTEKDARPLARAKGGMTDIKQDKAMVKKAVHKHEAAMHPGKPMTKLRKGGMPC